MPVTTIKQQYLDELPTVQRTRAAVAGQKAIKDGGLEFLPCNYAKDEPEAYQALLERAYFMEVTGRTQRAYMGMVFRKPATLDMPAVAEPFIENIDGAGNSVEYVAMQAFKSLTESPRFGFFVDYPQVDPNIDRETEARLGLRPTIASYPFESIVNWRHSVINGRRMLSLVVLKEEENRSDDEFSEDNVTVYRVLRMRDGVYTQQMYDENGEPQTDEYTPLVGGVPYQHIPFQIAEVDSIALAGLANVNISHYQTVANIEETGWNLGQVMMSMDIGDTEATEFYEMNGGSKEKPPKFRFGTRFAYVSKGGSANIVQAQPTDYNKDLAAIKENQMIAIGAQLVQRRGQAETAEAARIGAASEASVIESIVIALNEALEAALEDFVKLLKGNPDDVSFVMNTQLFDQNLSAQDLQVVIAGYQQRLYSQADGLYMIRKGAIELRPDVDDESIIEQTATEFFDEP